MKDVKDLNYYELLNISEDADQNEINRAYLLAMATYHKDSITTYTLISEEERVHIANRIEEAYRILKDARKRDEYDINVLKKKTPKVREKSPFPKPGHRKEVQSKQVKTQPLWQKLKAWLPKEKHKHEGMSNGETGEELSRLLGDYSLSTGKYLRTIRETRGITLKEVSESTKISVMFLKALEEDNYKQLPRGDTHAKGFLRIYAKFLDLSPEEVLRGKCKGHP